jgi:hypothetical protein
LCFYTIRLVAAILSMISIGVECYFHFT